MRLLYPLPTDWERAQAEMSDAATRFYQRNFEWHAAQGSVETEDELLAAMHAGNGRYSAAWRHLLANPGLGVLELGCGSPALAGVIGPRTGSYTIVDIVEARLGADNPANVRTIVANLDADWPVESAAFDMVNAMMVIEHLYDPFHSFRELARVLKPGGHAFVNLPNIASIRCRLDLLLGRVPWTSVPDWFERGEWDGNHLHYFTVASVKRIAAHVGLTVESLHPVGGMIWLKRLRPQLFCHEITFVLRKPAASG
jgi:SAM-dependent methyltransferase